MGWVRVFGIVLGALIGLSIAGAVRKRGRFMFRHAVAAFFGLGVAAITIAAASAPRPGAPGGQGGPAAAATSKTTQAHMPSANSRGGAAPKQLSLVAAIRGVKSAPNNGSGQLVSVMLDMSNHGNRPLSTALWTFDLLDRAGRVYAFDATATYNDNGFLDSPDDVTINPGIDYHGTLDFDVPKALPVADLSLRIEGAGIATITLPLSTRPAPCRTCRAV